MRVNYDEAIAVICDTGIMIPECIEVLCREARRQIRESVAQALELPIVDYEETADFDEYANEWYSLEEEEEDNFSMD